MHTAAFRGHRRGTYREIAQDFSVFVTECFRVTFFQENRANTSLSCLT